MADSTEQTAIATDYFRQWTVLGAKSGALRPKPNFSGSAERNYNLKNKLIRKFLQHEEQRFGINLGWTDDAEPGTARRVTRWFVARQGAGDHPVRYGESVALGYGIKPSFIRNTHRDIGIDLDWSEGPVFEWKLLGGQLGQNVKTGEWIAIYNVKAQECMLLFDRSAGADIGWPSSKTWGEQLDARVREAVKNHARNAYDKLLGRD